MALCLDYRVSTLWVLMLGMLAGCGGAEGPAGDGPVIGGRPQQLVFTTVPRLEPGEPGTVAARASSGLPVSYASGSPSVCTLDAGTGAVSIVGAGTCVVMARQRGDRTWAPARASMGIEVARHPQQIEIDGVTTMAVGDLVTLTARASSGLPVKYESASPEVCTVDAGSGRVTARAPGPCSIQASQPGNARYQSAPVMAQQIVVMAAGQPRPPGAPRGVTARPGGQADIVLVSADNLDGGGGAVTQYTVRSEPPGISAESASLPVSVRCPGSCSGHAFTLSASTAQGSGPESEAAEVIGDYEVVVRFREPDYAHDMTEFHGRFRFNATRQTVHDLQGELSEVMAGNNQPGQPYPDGMPLLPLRHQLSAIPAPGGGGLLVTTFLLPRVETLSADPRDGGTDGWSPGKGGWKYWGYDGGSRRAPNPGNAYARIFVDTEDPTRPPTAARIALLAYADCAPEGMMGDDCMTGTSVAAHGTVGSMRGYPLSQEIRLR